MQRWRTIAAVTSATLALTVPIGALASGPGSLPPVVTSTTLGPKPTSTDPAAMDPTGLVPRARDGLIAFAVSYPEVADEDGGDIDLAECPLATPAELTAVLAPIGDARPVEPALGASIELDVTDIGTSYSVVCDTEDNDAPTVGPIHGLGLAVGDLGGVDDAEIEDFADVLADEGASVIDPSAATFGGRLYLLCEPDDTDPEGTTRCLSFLLHPDLVVAMFVTVDADAEAATIAALEDAFVSFLPVLLERVAAGLALVPVVDGDPVLTSVDAPCADPSAPGCVEPPASIAVIMPSTTMPKRATAPGLLSQLVTRR